MSADWEARVRENQRGNLASNRLREQLGALGGLHRRIRRQREVARDAGRECDKIRRELTEAARRRKSLERLRDRMQDDYRDECAAFQMKRTDDMNTTRAALRATGGADHASITGVPS